VGLEGGVVHGFGGLVACQVKVDDETSLVDLGDGL
jgi:hypothetical protein